jgi:peptide/nickel transport system ATP-binding protein
MAELDRALLRVEDLSIRTASGATLVDKLTFDLGAERVALVGESGSGKSLTARAVLGLLRPPLSVTAARLELDAFDLRSASVPEWSRLRGSMVSLMLQDPRFSLNPVIRVGRQIDEILTLHGKSTAAARRDRIRDMLSAVGLDATRRILEAYPHQLSGGMGQRVMLAVMLINGPRLLIADEPTSALDAGLRDQVLELMMNLVEKRRMGLLLISHDLPQVARYCDRVLVMYQGRIVDRCSAISLAQASHPYTRTLWNCRPSGRTYGTELPVLDRGWAGNEATS